MPSFLEFIKFILEFILLKPLLFIGALAAQYTARVSRKREHERHHNIMRSTDDLVQWRAAAASLDDLHGFQEWRSAPVKDSRFCNQEEIERETRFIETLVETQSIESVGRYLESHLVRNPYGVYAPELFEYYTEPKDFVVNFTTSVIRMIRLYLYGMEFSPPRVSKGLHSSPRFQDSRASRSLSSTLSLPHQSPKLSTTDRHLHHFPVSARLRTKRSVHSHHRTKCFLRDHMALLHWALEDQHDIVDDSIRLNSTSDIYSIPQQTDRTSWLPSLSIIRTKLNLLKRVARSYGRTALFLSGGANLGLYNIGTMTALWDTHLLPTVICGSSAGSIVGAIFCTRTDEELEQTLEKRLTDTFTFRPFDATNSTASLRQKLSRLFRRGCFFDKEVFIQCLQENYGQLTFIDAFERTGRILNVSVASTSSDDRKTMILNYITSPNVLIWSAVAASSAAPGLFDAVQLMQRDHNSVNEPYLPGQLWYDGSVSGDVPKERIAELFNIRYFIVSQTNPHVVPFIRGSRHPKTHMKFSIFTPIWTGVLNEVRYWLLKLFRMGVLSRTGSLQLFHLLLAQSYGGDLTLCPVGNLGRALPDFINIATNPTPHHIDYVRCHAQRRVWPFLNEIQYTTEIERALGDAVALLTQLEHQELRDELNAL